MKVHPVPTQASEGRGNLTAFRAENAVCLPAFDGLAHCDVGLINSGPFAVRGLDLEEKNPRARRIV